MVAVWWARIRCELNAAVNDRCLRSWARFFACAMPFSVSGKSPPIISLTFAYDSACRTTKIVDCFFMYLILLRCNLIHNYLVQYKLMKYFIQTFGCPPTLMFVSWSTSTQPNIRFGGRAPLTVCLNFFFFI